LKPYLITLTGKVQGVGFRRSVQQRAWEFGIKGQIENRDDGSVKIVAQGEDEQLGEFIGSLKSIELPAEVKNVEKTSAKVLKTRRAFKIKHGETAEDLDEGLGGGQEQLALLRKDLAKFSESTSSNFTTLANRYAKISDALEVLTSQTKQFTEALTTLTNLAKDYFDERRSRDSAK